MNDRRAKSEPALSVRRAFSIGDAVLILLIALGLALRFRQYLFDRSFWLDEAKIAKNVLNRSFGELLTAPLASNQSAPPGFLVWARGTVVAIGTSEWALRLIPMIAGILLLVLAFVLARRELKSIAAQVTLVGLIALSPVLIFYSSEFKQYASDALFALAILVAVSYRHTRYGNWLLAGVGFLAIVCSLPAVFVAAPAGLLILYEAIRASSWRPVLIVGAAWMAAAALHGAYVLQAGVDTGFMVRSWGSKGSFAPLLPTSLAELKWYPAALSGLIYLIFGEVGHTYTRVNGSWFYPLGWPLMLILPLAAIAVVLRRRWTAIVAVGAIVTTMLAAGLHAYPFAGRLLIFLVPVTLFIIASGVDELDRLAGYLVAGAVAVVLVAIVIPTDAAIARKPYTKSEMRAALQVVNERFEDGDAIIAWYAGLYDYYDHTLTVSDVFVVSVGAKTQASSVVKTMRDKGYRRGWFVAAHKAGSTSGLIKEIAKSAPIEFEWKAPGTRVVLFDFTTISPAE